MNILGIETSCDETGAAVVQNGRIILSNVVASSLSHHERYGGVIPEIASRKQLEFIHSVIHEALTQADLTLKNIDAVAVTQSPGLLGSLLVGTSYANAMGFALKKPVIPVDHIKAHLYAGFLKKSRTTVRGPRLPAIGLIVSGGHSSLYHMKDMAHWQLLGQTRDDAAGEAFDKTARILELGYPGGPVIDALAKKSGKNNRIRFAPARIPQTFDFCFSGTKTAVLYYHQKHQKNLNYNIANVAAAFQNSVVDILVKKSIQACLEKGVDTLVVGGGVAANSALRQTLQSKAKEQKIKTFFPELSLCMDNAAMVAGYGYHLTNHRRRN